ncbi:histidinol-phosphate transaminase [Pseudomarimonas arenosa]|uniref:Histidinol-phosphate aminotransferase n=1 Tax=Pseudomarimonas arenosa TaxID=2774145 RepID=A0AAW3ZS51_9GAMM|nr:histidinol-phosphate transaminase [Pseudomarimonas arenosa]MBD8527695.1 histidinol-phosphate transaminase [Pseudomarimonas arenosa]
MSGAAGKNPGLLDLVRPDLRQFAGYSSARKEASGGAIWLNANESPWSVAGDQQALNRYPEPQPVALIERLANLYAVQSGELLVGRGSDELIDLLVRALCRAGQDKVLVSSPTFGMYAVSTRLQGAELIDVPLLAERGFALNVEGIEAALDSRVKLVFVCSPNNPTGAAVSTDDLADLARRLQGRALVVVDEAYAEFSAQQSALSLRPRFPHIAVLRTLSKAYGLAGARIGSLIADPALIAVLNAIMAPYPLPTPSVAAALRGLDEKAVVLARSRINLISEERRRLAAELAQLPEVSRVWPSDANFLLLRCADATAMYQRAQRAGIIIRRPAAHPALENCLRISIGTPEQNDALIAALRATREAA